MYNVYVPTLQRVFYFGRPKFLIWNLEISFQVSFPQRMICFIFLLHIERAVKDYEAH